MKFFLDILTILISLFGGIKFYLEYARGNRQRQEELRWKRAELAERILSELYNSFEIRSAFKMLDWSERIYITENKKKYTITDVERNNALRVSNLDSLTDKEVFVRDCYENLFDKLDRIIYFIKADLLLQEDIVQPLSYYLNLIKQDLNAFEPFLMHYGYKSVAFLIKKQYI